MPAQLDLTGQRFGRLVALRRGPGTQPGSWFVRCDCGVIKWASVSHLRSGRSKACRPCSHTAHGGTGGKAFRAWQAMIARCTNKNLRHYHRYGGRGITVSRRWVASFKAFLADMGDPPTPHHSLERKNNNLGYAKANCCWATKKQQSRNTSSNIRVTHLGQTRLLIEWAELRQIPVAVLRNRLKRGWSIAEALTTRSARRTARRLTYRGRTLSIAGWAARTEIPYNVLYHRLVRAGWPTSRAFTAPARKIGRHK